MTVVGTGELSGIVGNKSPNTWRNCSRRLATRRMSFSLALPTNVKFFDETLVQVSFALAGCPAPVTKRTSAIPRTAVRKGRYFILRPLLKLMMRGGIFGSGGRR